MLTLAIEWCFAIPHVVRWDIERHPPRSNRGYAKIGNRKNPLPANSRRIESEKSGFLLTTLCLVVT